MIAMLITATVGITILFLILREDANVVVLEDGTRHTHEYVREGYGGAGRFAYRCACGATDIG